jgi:hypothetical protein
MNRRVVVLPFYRYDAEKDLLDLAFNCRETVFEIDIVIKEIFLLEQFLALFYSNFALLFFNGTIESY